MSLHALQILTICLIAAIPIPAMAIDLYFVIKHGHSSMFGDPMLHVLERSASDTASEKP